MKKLSPNEAPLSPFGVIDCPLPFLATLLMASKVAALMSEFLDQSLPILECLLFAFESKRSFSIVGAMKLEYTPEAIDCFKG